MKRYNIFINGTLAAIILAILTLLSTSCMQTDDTEGPWFGSWHLETIMINGEPDTSYNSNPEIMINFAGEVFNLAYMERAEIYGTWSYAGEVLTLIAGYHAGNGAQLSYLFNPFPVAMHFPADVEQIEITVTKIEGKQMQWQYIDENGRLLTYNFRKYP